MPMKIVISGWYGFGNIGDEAILQSLIYIFKIKYGTDTVITIFSFDPEYTRKTQNTHSVKQLPCNLKGWVKSIIDTSLYPTIKALRDCDLFVLGGGGFLSDWQKEAPLQWLSQARLAKLFGKRAILFGIGAGPFISEKGKKTTKTYIDKYIDEITVRDNYSYEALINDVGIDKAKVVITCDPAFALDVKNDFGISRGNTIGINFVELFKFRAFKGGEEKFNRYISDLKQIIRFLQDTFPEWKIEFVPMFKGDSNFFTEYFASEFPAITLVSIENYRELVDHLYSYKLFIGTRFHSILFALRTNTPLFALIYHPKSQDLCDIYHINNDVISDGSFPPLFEKDLDLNIIESSIVQLILNQQSE